MVLLSALLALLLVLVGVAVLARSDNGEARDVISPLAAVVVVDESTPTPTPTPSPEPVPTPTPRPELPDYDGWWNPAAVGYPYGEEVEGLLTFRGSPNRTYYGEGPVPSAPEIAWTFPSDPNVELCSQSIVGGVEGQWCGTGWTGQPAVFERDGRTWVVFGSMASAVHFLDGEDGTRILPDFTVGDIIKGSVTIDPDGFPLVYFGARDDKLRVVSFDGPEPVELWSFDADDVEPTLWNDDWDGTPLVLDDYLFEGGENSRIHIFRLNRAFDDAGRVTVDPELVFDAAGWDDELLETVGENVSIESSVTISGNTLYFANSGGLVQGWDIEGLDDGVEPERTFRYWTGDDTDASIVVDDEGMLYVGVEYERFNARAQEEGQIIKLDPTKPDDPVVWSIAVQQPTPEGVWATAAIHGDLLYVPTNQGFLHAIDRHSGEISWSKKLQGPTWSSPVVVDDVLIQTDCEWLVHGYDVSDPSVEPPELWRVSLDWCVESTPAVWKGTIYVGDRSGRFFALRDPIGT